MLEGPIVQVRHALLVPARQVLVLLSSQLQRTMNTTTTLPSLSTWTHGGGVGRHSQNRRAPSCRQVSRSARLRLSCSSTRRARVARQAGALSHGALNRLLETLQVVTIMAGGGLMDADTHQSAHAAPRPPL